MWRNWPIAEQRGFCYNNNSQARKSSTSPILRDLLTMEYVDHSVILWNNNTADGNSEVCTVCMWDIHQCCCGHHRIRIKTKWRSHITELNRLRYQLTHSGAQAGARPIANARTSPEARAGQHFCTLATINGKTLSIARHSSWLRVP